MVTSLVNPMKPKNNLNLVMTITAAEFVFDRFQ